MCIGNRSGGDDAVGPYIFDKLSNKRTSDIKILDCGTTPENYTSVVKSENPENLIIIDAVEMDIQPGEIRQVPKERIGKFCVSTHGMPLSLIIEYLEKYVKNILFIGIQPKTMEGAMTDKIKESADALVKIIFEKRIESIKKL
jgi:hydrogenase 3 maturation protease